MSLIIGLTGGIGSGKSTVGNILEEFGWPLYNADTRAKWVMNNSLDLKEKLMATFGEDVFVNNALNRPFLAEKTFNSPDELAKLNNIVHPAVFQDFVDWQNQNKSQAYLVKEAAILFESGSYKQCDLVITVAAKESLRIERVKKRDGLTDEQIQSRINNQWTDAQKIEKSDYVIFNEGDLNDLQRETQVVFERIKNQFPNSK